MNFYFVRRENIYLIELMKIAFIFPQNAKFTCGHVTV